MSSKLNTVAEKELNTMFSILDLKAIVANVMGINLQEWLALTEKRGMRPVKAAIRLGADANKAQLIADLDLAVTEEEINTVYANANLRSCMVGVEVGLFYSTNKIGVIYSKNFRVLVGLETEVLCNSSYGYKRDAIIKLINSYFKEGLIIKDIKKEVVVRTDNRYKGVEPQRMIRSYFINSTKPYDMPSDWNENDIKQEFLRMKESKNFQGKYFSLSVSERSVSDARGFYRESLEDGDFERISDSVFSYELYEFFEGEAQIYQKVRITSTYTMLDLQYPENCYVPFLDFDDLLDIKNTGEEILGEEIVTDIPF